MSSELAIAVNGLSKCYQIYARPQDRLKQSVLPRLRRLFGQPSENYYQNFWALHNISFEVNVGETVGIIGRNGSGKSTLLQLICGTLNQTSGSIQAFGRVAALLELGSGFNPDFTGRDNVYLNAVLLGLSKNETTKRLDSILKFADIGEYIDQPVKTYSSGMLVRLAFAVIAHVDADVLVIDEALAVGDAIFTQKCMRFLREFSEKRTLLFVSHDVNTVRNLCKRAVWIEQGKVRLFGSAQEVTKAYDAFCLEQIYGDSVSMDFIEKVHEVPLQPAKVDPETTCILFENIQYSDGWRTGAAEIDSVVMLQADGNPVTTLLGGESVLLRIGAKVYEALSSPIIGFFVKDRLGQSLFGEHTYTYSESSLACVAGEYIIARFHFTLPLLPNGDYSMTVSIADGTPYDHVQHHWLHDAMILHVSSNKLRYGLVGIPFDFVSLAKGVKGDGKLL